jgi:hypothetical protein
MQGGGACIGPQIAARCFSHLETTDTCYSSNITKNPDTREHSILLITIKPGPLPKLPNPFRIIRNRLIPLIVPILIQYPPRLALEHFIRWQNTQQDLLPRKPRKMAR